MRLIHCPALLLAVAVGVPAARAQAFSPPLKISDTTDFQGAPTPKIVTDAKGNINIAWQQNTSGIYFKRSTDGGVTFSTAFNIPRNFAPDIVLITLAVDGSGVIDLAWSEPRSTPGFGASYTGYFSRSTDGGASFSSPITVMQDAGTRLEIAASPDGHIYLFFGNSLFRSSDGVNFSGPSTVFDFSASTAYSSISRVAVTSDGTLYIAWGDSACNVLFSRSVDQGSTFSSPMILSSSAQCEGSDNFPQIVVDSADGINVTWHDSHGLVFARSTDGGASFSTQSNASQNMAGASFEVERGGNIDAVWVGPINPPSPVLTQIVFARSTDGGATFSSAAPVSGKVGIAGLARISVGPRDDRNVVWVEDFNGNDNFNVYFSHAAIAAPGGDFTISAAPASKSELPGGAAKFNLTLTGTRGFSDAVNLSCGKQPSGAECVFDSTSVTPTGSGAQTMLTVTTPPTMAAGNFTVTITAASGSISHTQDVQVAVGGISGSVSPTSATISVGSSADFAVNVTSSGGFDGQADLVCSGLASGLSCSFNPAQVSLPAKGSANSTLTVSVASKPSISRAAPPAANLKGPLSRNPLTMILALTAVLCVVIVRGRLLRITRGWDFSAGGVAAFVLAFVLAVGLISCGGTTSSKTSTSAGGSTGGSGGAGGTGGTGGGGGSPGGGTGGGGSGSGGSVSGQFTVQAQSGGGTVNLGTLSVTVP